MTLTSKHIIYTFHDSSAYNASDLNGAHHNSQSYDVAVIWAVPASSYDGVLNFELSPDNGTTWLSAEVSKIEDSTDLASTFTFSGSATEGFIMILPEAFKIRVRLSGGTAGSVSVYGRIVDGRF